MQSNHAWSLRGAHCPLFVHVPQYGSQFGAPYGTKRKMFSLSGREGQSKIGV